VGRKANLIRSLLWLALETWNSYEASELYLAAVLERGGGGGVEGGKPGRGFEEGKARGASTGGEGGPI